MMRVLLLLAVLLPALVHAEEPMLKPFQRGSARAIAEARAGHPFVLAFWSVDCVHCRAELEQLAALSRAHPQLDLVLVSTDPPEAAQGVLDVLRQYELPRAEHWVFADDFTERLRFEVDPRWHGELPRTYLHGPGTAVEAITGRIDMQHLNRWLKVAQDGRD